MQQPSHSNYCGSCNCPIENELNVGKPNFEFCDNNSFISGVVEFSAAVDYIYRISSNDIFDKLNGSHNIDNGLNFCISCGKLLELCYVAHKNFESTIHPQSVIQELLKNKSESEEEFVKEERWESLSTKIISEPTEPLEDTFSDLSFPCANYEDSDEPNDEQIDIKFDPLLDSTLETSESIDDIKSLIRNRKVVIKLERLPEEEVPASKFKDAPLRRRKSKKTSNCTNKSDVPKVKKPVPARHRKPAGKKSCINAKESGKRWKCPTCEKDFIDYNYLKYRHLPTHTNDRKPRHLCQYCGKRLNTRYNLKQHYLFKHAPETEKLKKMEQCQICGKLIFSLKLKTHMKSHGPKVTHKCDHCDKEYVTLAYLQDHMVRVHTDSNFPCDLCGKKLPSQLSLQLHMIKHGPKEYACDQCPLTFIQNSRLVRHKKTTHSSERPLVCQECGKTYKYASQLTLHLKLHREIAENGEGCVQCDECGKYFKHSLGLHKHKSKIHRENRNWKINKCSFCGKILSDGTSLRNHEDLHRKKSNFKPNSYRKGQKIHWMANEHSLNPSENME